MLPLQLSGKSLGERQKQLNDIIKNTDSWHPDYDVTNENDNDIDIIYKIKLASKLKKFKYLVDVLKSADSLYISTVLKQPWIFDEEYSDIINPHYLDKEIFPYMSEKMIKKLLSALSMHIKEDTRLKSFCEYCYARDRKDIAKKFIYRASESYKLDFLKKGLISRYDKEFIKLFVGKSFKLAYACLEQDIWISPLYFIGLYSTSRSQYLDMLEKYEERCIDKYNRVNIGLRLSKGIVKNYKNRILERPQLYWNCLNSKVLLKNINVDDAKIIVAALFPEKVTDFWNNNFYDSYKDLINIIPLEARYEFVKDNFERKYHEEEFEMTFKFFDNSMYTLMTRKQQESWALKHLEKNEGFFGDTKNYSWYKFINFDLSFTRLKSIIKITIEYDRRIKLLEVLLESTCNQEELEVLLKYFYERHINEQKRDRFVEKVVEKYNIFELNENCWSAFDKLLHALEVYKQHSEYGYLTKFRIISLLYHIMHDISLPESLNVFITKRFSSFYIKQYFDKLNDKQKVYDFLINFLIRKIEHYENEEYSTVVQDTVRPLLLTAVNLLQFFDRKVEDYPNLITKYAKQDIDHFGHLFKQPVVSNIFTQDDLLRLLKTDVSLLNEKIPLVNNHSSGVLNTFLKKIKVYFSNDAAKEWLKHFTNVLGEQDCYREIKLAVYAIFALADNEQKNSMMIKYSPKSAKIDHTTINFHEECVQEAICRFVAYSRPPVAINTIMLYIKGDYVRFCMPMFGMILSNWTKPKCIAFIQLLLDTPVSVQKHGIRLAFKCFNSEDLSKLVINSWKQTKNVSLKTILFKSLYSRISREENKGMQKELLETLKSLMTEVQDSYEDIYACFGGTCIPDCFKRDFLEHAWNIVKKLPEDSVNQSRKREVLMYISSGYCLMDEGFVHEIVKAQIEECMTIPKIAERNVSYNETKWELIVKHITTNKSENSLAKKILLLKEITSKTIEMWNEIHIDSYIMKNFLTDFIQRIEEKALSDYLRSAEKTKLTIIFNTIQDALVSLPKLDIYLIIWKLKLNMVFHDTIDSYKHSKGHLPTNYAEFNEMVIFLGKAVANTLKEFVDRGQFFPSLLYYIKEMLNRLSYSMYIPTDSENLSINSDSYGVLLSVGLVTTDLVETHMLALKMLPSECPEAWEKEFHLIIHKIKSIDNEELQFSLHHKYCGDFKRRKFM